MVGGVGPRALLLQRDGAPFLYRHPRHGSSGIPAFPRSEVYHVRKAERRLGGTACLGYSDAVRINPLDADANAMRQTLQGGTSAGGARAKAVIAWNEQTNETRSGQIAVGSGFDY